MICPQCRIAASLVTEAEVTYQYLNGRPQETLAGWEAALLVHAECRGGTWCDCQHVIPARSVPRPVERLTLDK